MFNLYGYNSTGGLVASTTYIQVKSSSKSKLGETNQNKYLIIDSASDLVTEIAATNSYCDYSSSQWSGVCASVVESNTSSTS